MAILCLEPPLHSGVEPLLELLRREWVDELESSFPPLAEQIALLNIWGKHRDAWASFEQVVKVVHGQTPNCRPGPEIRELPDGEKC